MNQSRRLTWLPAICVMWAAAASAQTTTTTPAQPSTSQSSDTPTRPATTTFDGDTGLWYVPTAETLGRGAFAASAYRSGFDYVEGFTNISELAATFSYGIYRNLQLFASFKFDTRIDRDLQPIFSSDPTVGGVNPLYPLDNQPWSSHVGDTTVGLKVGLLSEEQQKPVALAVRGMVKLPTGDKTDGASTGKVDGFLDLVLSKDINKKVEFAAYGGVAVRGQPAEVTESNGFRYGAGVGLPSHAPLRFTAEVTGEKPFDNTVTLNTLLIASDGSVAPTTSTLQNFTAATLGLTWQLKGGFFLGGGASWTFPRQSTTGYVTEDGSANGRFVDYQIRIGYSPGVHVYVPPPSPPAPPPPPPPPAAAANRPPTVVARCEPCTVEIGRTSTVTADARDPDGDPLTYRWTTPTGTLATPTERQTIWTAPQQEGTVPVRVTVNDGRGGTASDAVNIRVVRPASKTYTFEDVYFDFDRYSLRPEATRLLDEAVNALREDATLRVQIEGHTCNIGTAEYNLALGDRRAAAVKAYLVSRGVAADRLSTISYGEERPKYDNSREETRRLNRRAALVVNLQR